MSMSATMFPVGTYITDNCFSLSNKVILNKVICISIGCVWFVLGTVDREIRLWQLDCHKIAGLVPFVDVQFH